MHTCLPVLPVANPLLLSTQSFQEDQSCLQRGCSCERYLQDTGTVTPIRDEPGISRPVTIQPGSESKTCRQESSRRVLLFLQVFVESLISRYRRMRRLRVTCWFAQTALSPLWYETAGRRNTAPASARRWRKTSTAGELHFPKNPARGFFMATFPSLLLCTRTIYIFSVFINSSSLNYFLCASAGLSTFNGTTGNATCFPLTVSATVCRSRPTSALLCMKKKVSEPPKVDFTRCGVFLMRTLRCREGFMWANRLLVIAGYACCTGSPVFKVFGFSVDTIIATNPPLTLPPFNHRGGQWRMHKHVAD